MTFSGGIMPQEGTVVNSSRRASLPGVMLTPPLLQVANVLLPARANSVASPVAPTPPLRRKPMGGALFLISGILDLVAAIFWIVEAARDYLRKNRRLQTVKGIR